MTLALMSRNLASSLYSKTSLVMQTLSVTNSGRVSSQVRLVAPDVDVDSLVSSLVDEDYADTPLDT